MFSKVDEGMKKGALEDIVVSAAGLITAAVSESGFLEAGTKKTKQLTVQAAKTVTPGKTAQTAVASGRYTTGAVTVSGDADLIPANIREGINIFGVNGTLKEGITGIDFGTVTLASKTAPVTVAHSLGVIPTWVALISSPLTEITSDNHFVSANFNEYSVILTDVYTSNFKYAKAEKTENSITFYLYNQATYNKFAAGDYYWIAIA